MLNVALVGCGSMAGSHAQHLLKIPEVNVVALCDIVPARTKLFREKYFPKAAEFESYDRMLESPPAKLDAVVLVTPHACHYPQCKSAMERGIHVLTEKPMVTSSEHAYDLWRTSERAGKLLAIAFQAPHTNEFGYLAEQRDAGQLGSIRLISGWVSQEWLKAVANTWRQDPAQSGDGQLYDTGAHLLNATMWLANSPVVEVGCFYDKCGSPVDINGVAIAKFQSGAMASICIGGSCPPFKMEMQIQTDKYLIVTTHAGSKLEIHRAGGKAVYPHVKAGEHPASGTPHYNFVQALLGKEKLRCPVRYGVLLSALMDAMYQSAASGQLVKVKPVPESI